MKMAGERSEVRCVGVLADITKRTSRNGNKYARLELHDEKGVINALFMDSNRESRLTDYLDAGNKLPATQYVNFSIDTRVNPKIRGKSLNDQG